MCAIPTRDFAVGTGKKRPGKRLLTVGTDCSIGKMYTALALEKEMRARGLKADFRATGQTGIFIAGDGVSIDAVVSDFVSGAVEWICPENDADHWDLVEGQGSLFHASYAGVTLGLIHGAQPDALVMCHEPHAAAYARPAALPAAGPADLHRRQSGGGAADQSGGAAASGLSFNTSALDGAAAERALTEYSQRSSACRRSIPCAPASAPLVGRAGAASDAPD